MTNINNADVGGKEVRASVSYGAGEQRKAGARVERLGCCGV